MGRKSKSSAIFVAVLVLLLHDFNGTIYAQVAVPTPQQLDQLLAPIALYPDTLVAQITTASTNPQEILDVDNWLKQQSANVNGAALQDLAQQQGFDPAFIALVNFPQVLDMMAQHIDDYAAIGAAFAANQAAVMDSIQRLRAQAYAAGALTNTPQQQVITQNQGGQQIIVIQPANPQVVYIPQYNPAVVYAGPSAVVAGALLTFGAGIAIGAMLTNRPWGWGGWGWNWGRRTVIVNHNVWIVRNNYYRPPRYTYRPRPVQYASRPGHGGNWSRPGNRPVPVNRPTGNNRHAGSYNAGNANKPSPLPNRPGNVMPPSQPNSRPPSNVGANRPANTRPAAPTNRPANPPRNPYAGYQANKGSANRPQETGGRPSVFGGSNSGRSERAASSRGQQSMGRSQKR